MLLLVFIILGIAFQSYSGAAGGLHDRGFGNNPNNFQLHLFNSRFYCGKFAAVDPDELLLLVYSAICEDVSGERLGKIFRDWIFADTDGHRATV